MATFLGYLLFAAIPVVLFLFVGHPEPLWASLAGGVVLMLGHRFVARPYMVRVKDDKCLWCNRMPPRPEASAVRLEPVTARACPGHAVHAERFFRWVERMRWPLSLGIFLPLLGLLGTLALAAVGVIEGGADSPWVEMATGVFRLAVGLAVNLAAWGYLLQPEEPVTAPIPVPFPVHNFFLLGVRTLLWIFRLVGVWWVILGVRGLVGGG
jgi:hypothetical protein